MSDERCAVCAGMGWTFEVRMFPDHAEMQRFRCVACRGTGRPPKITDIVAE